MGVSRFCVENLLSRSAENFRRESFTVALISSIEKVWISEGGVSRFSVENFLSHSAENFRGESFTVALISGTEKVCKREGGYQDFPSKMYCLTVPKISVGNPLLLHQFRVPKKFGEEGGYQDFTSKMFCLTVPKISVGNPLLLQYFGVSKKFGQEGGGGVSRFSVENLLSHCAEYFRRESFTVALISGAEKVWRRGGWGYQDFTSKICCLAVPKISVGNPLLLHYFRVSRKFG